MALTMTRWVALAIAGSAVAGALVTRDRSPGAAVIEPRLQLDRAASAAQRAAVREADRLRFLQVFDSLQAGTLKGASADTSRWLIDPRLPASIRNPLTALHARSRRFRSARPATGIDVVFVLDSTTALRGVRMVRDLVEVDYALPRGAGDRCVVTVSVRPAEIRPTYYERGQFRALSTDFFAHRLLGPCGFYEWFGNPGAGVDAWLRDGAWAYGFIAGEWRRAAQPWQPWNRWWMFASFGARQAGWPLRDFVSAPAYRCFTGDPETCEGLAADARSVRPDSINPVWGSRFVSPVDPLESWSMDRSRFVLGPVEGSLLGYFVHRYGEQRFAEFWRAAGPVDQAFGDAMGRPLGDAIAAWGAEVYGVQHRGPGLQAGATGAALLLGVVALALAIRTARRREIR